MTIILFDRFYGNQYLYYSNSLLTHALCSISIVFSVCLVIELIRQRTIGIAMERLIDSIILKVQKNIKV